MMQYNVLFCCDDFTLSQTNYINHPQIKTLSLDYSTQSFMEALQSITKDWKPDVVVWYDIISSTPIPPDIVDCPYPTILNVSDWNSLHTYIVDLFDFIMCGYQMKKLLSFRSKQNYVYWPANFSFDKHRFKAQSSQEKIYDISFIGSLSYHLRSDRGKYLKQIAELADRYSIYIGDRIFGDEYLRVLSQSKIIFNCSQYQELNPRVFEVTQMEALLFMEDNNQVIQDYLPDREGCVLYNASNLKELLIYYLENEGERLKVAQKGHQLIQEYSYQRQFDKFFEILPEIIKKIKDGSQRSFQKLTDTLQKQVLSRYLSKTAYSTISFKAFQCATDIYFDSDVPTLSPHLDYRLLCSAALCLIEYIYAIPENESMQDGYFIPPIQDLLKMISHYIDLAINQEQKHPILHFNRAWVAELLRDYEKAIEHYEQAIHLLQHTNQYFTSPQDIFENSLLLIYPKGYYFPEFHSNFYFEWQNVFQLNANQLDQVLKKFQHLVIWQCSYRIGSLYYQKKDWVQAKSYYQKGLNVYPDLCVMDLQIALCNIKQKNYPLAINTLKNALQKQPMMPDLWHVVSQLPSETYLLESLLELLNDIIICLEVMPQNQELLKKISQQKHFCQLIQELNRSKEPDIDIIFNMTKKHLNQAYYRQLTKINSHLSSIQFDFLKNMKISWNPLIPEPLPEEVHALDLSLTHRDFCGLTFEQNNYQRHYHKKSNLQNQSLGVDLVPYQFPTNPLDTLPIEDLSEFNFLVFYQDLTSKSMVEFIHAYNQIHANSQTTCFIYNPLNPPTEHELLRLEQLLPADIEANISILTDPLDLSEQGALLNLMQVSIFPDLTNWLNYYFWWSLYSGTEVRLNKSPSFFPYSNISLDDIETLIYPSLEQLFESRQRHSMTVKKIKDNLQLFYAHENSLRLLQTFWFLKLKEY